MSGATGALLRQAEAVAVGWTLIGAPDTLRALKTASTSGPKGAVAFRDSQHKKGADSIEIPAISRPDAGSDLAALPEPADGERDHWGDFVMAGVILGAVETRRSKWALFAVHSLAIWSSSGLFRLRGSPGTAVRALFDTCPKSRISSRIKGYILIPVNRKGPVYSMRTDINAQVGKRQKTSRDSDDCAQNDGDPQWLQ